MLSNRLSYALGLMGPSMTVDTACSASLVALRQACLHLRDGAGADNRGPRVALVGGINLLLSPVPFELCTKVRADTRPYESLFLFLPRAVWLGRLDPGTEKL